MKYRVTWVTASGFTGTSIMTERQMRECYEIVSADPISE